MKKFVIFLRILGISFFSYRAYVAYGKIDINSVEPPLYSSMFYIWIILIMLVIIKWTAELFSSKKVNDDARDKQFKDIQKYL